ncbi:MAG: alpha/beta hydrolase, partial [Bacteroidota bacterium]|nr:alpha/beta hydrolase [Bacteroidota bacterium]
MKSRIYLFIACLFAATGLSAQSNQSVIAIWPSGVPESNGITVPEGNRNGIISNVSVPSMTVYPAAAGKNTGAAVLVCPGGSYICQASIHEGSQIAAWFSENGITAFVLKYRLPNGHAFIPSKDALQAIRIIRTRASEWGI